VGTVLIGLFCLTGRHTIVDYGMIESVNYAVHAGPQLQGSSINQQSTRLLELAGWTSATIAAELGRLRAEQSSTMPTLQNLSNTAAMAAALSIQATSVTEARVLSLLTEQAALTNLLGKADSGTGKVNGLKEDSRQSDAEPFATSDDEDSTGTSSAPFDPLLLHAIEMALETMQIKMEFAGWSGSLAACVFPGEALAPHLRETSAAQAECDLVLMVCAFDGSFGATGHVLIMGYESDRLVVTCDALRVADESVGERGSGEDIWSISGHNLDVLQASVYCRINDESFAGIRIARQRLVAEPRTWQLCPRVATWC